MLSLLVLADDFTGALDTGVQFAARGSRAYVTPDGDRDAPEDADVLVIDTGSRHLPAQEAYARVRAAIERHPAARRVYKKTDSVLRGNIGAELAALRDAVGRPVHFAPAFPRVGRTTRDGIQLADGVPVHLFGFAKDPANPVTESAVARVIARQSAMRVSLAPDVSGAVVVYDAATDADLAAIARALPEGARALAGCAGFAAHVPLDAGASAARVTLPKGPTLTISGSVAAQTMAQLAFLRERGREILRLSEDTEAMAERVAARLRRGECVTIATALPGDGLISTTPEERGRISALPGALARQVLALLAKEQTAVSALCVVGGDALRGVIAGLAIPGLWPVRELLPGVALSISEGYALPIISKSGGFGNAEALWKIEGST